MKLLTLGLCLLSILASVNAYKILVTVPVNGKSHWSFLQSIIEALINRGHEVTCITPLSFNGPKPVNYTEILIDPPFELAQIADDNTILRMSEIPLILIPREYLIYAELSSKHSLNTKNVQEFIKRKDLHFDLVINEDFYQEAWLMFGHKFNAPIVTICPTGFFEYFDRDMGFLTPYSHVSHTVLPYTDDMSFTQRWYNSLVSIFEWTLREWTHIPSQNEIAKKYFGHLGPLPSVKQMIANVSLILTNAHRSLFHPRPSMPTLISIGGAHIKKPKPLPADLQKFNDESEHGVILFSLGTMVPASKMPKEKLNAFLESFKKLKQRVLWKFDDESLANVPSNVLIRKWLPQNDVLAHPNIVLFISQGGMFSNFESIHFGVPMLMIPFFADQTRNAIKAEKAGYGRFLDFNDLTTDTLTATLNEMLSNQKYSEKAKEFSAIFNDNMVHPMDEAMWWIEYVARFKGAKHLKSHAVEMSLFQYLLLDVLLVNLLILIIVLYAAYALIRKICLYRKSSLDMKKQN